MVQSNMAKFLTRLFDAWNNEGIRYLILRNHENLPEHTGNDVDILIDPRQLGAVQDVLARVAKAEQWQRHNVGEFACLSIFFSQEHTLEQLHIDLMTSLNWHALNFMEGQLVLDGRQKYKNFYIPHPAHEAAVNLLTRLIYGGYVREKYRAGILQAAQENKLELVNILSPMLGTGLSNAIVSLAVEKEWGKIESHSGLIRKKVLLANVGHPGKMIATLWMDVMRLVRRVGRSPGLSIVFFGPDGCGKTSVADELKSELEKTFYLEKGLHCHWKPIRPSGEPVIPTEDPHGKPPRNRGLSLAYFTYHCSQFILGWWRYVKPVLFKNGLVIIDRYYYDFLVDQRRYRLNIPQWIIKAGFLFVKKPDLVFCLDADPEILQARKKEVTFEECTRQRNAYRTLAEKLSHGHVIDASQPLENVTNDVKTIVLQYMTDRTERWYRRSH